MQVARRLIQSAGRLLFEPHRLGIAERSRRRPGVMCVPLVRGALRNPRTATLIAVRARHAQTSQVTKLSEFQHNDLVTSGASRYHEKRGNTLANLSGVAVSWMGRGGHIALGSNSGQVRTVSE